MPALLDQEPGALVRDDLVGLERLRAQHAHRVVVRQHEVAERLVGVLAQLGDPVARRRRGGPRLEADEEVLPSIAPTFGSPSAVRA
jgi:hypothetical protein